MDAPLPQRYEFKSVNGGPPRASAFVAHTADATQVLLDAVNKVAQAQSGGSLTIGPSALRDAVAVTSITRKAAAQPWACSVGVGI